MQCVHVLFGLFSGPAQVADDDFGLCFPSGDAKGCGERVFMYICDTPLVSDGRFIGPL